ncbi:hypothetical protein Bbelb_239790 [Branchiostoma belcheri]|nr:hypothetical protein Bbelb_239790 [Branchiostoma belcheri]
MQGRTSLRPDKITPGPRDPARTKGTSSTRLHQAKLLPAEGESCLHDLPPSGQNTARISDQVMIPAEGESCLHDLPPSGQNTARISDQVGYSRVLTEISDYGVDSGSYCPSRGLGLGLLSP